MPRVTITVPGSSPQPYRFQLDRRLVTLGRGSNNDIVINCGSVSVSHAEMRRIDGGYELRDLGSTNGIKLDGERQPVIRLRSGLSVKLGDVAFDFQLSDEELEALEREQPGEESSILRELEETPEPQSKEEQPPEEEEDDEEPKRSGWAWVLGFLLLTAVAFCIGMAVRFEKETGNSWIDAVKSHLLSAPADDNGAK